MSIKPYYIMHSGSKVWVDPDTLSIEIENINLDDIAHHLTKICRYTGALALSKHYSVAQHSIALCLYAQQHSWPMRAQKALLMHDASEAYLGDVNGVLKRILPDYLELEAKVTERINTWYCIEQCDTIDRLVEDADKRILLNEAKAFMPEHYHYFKEQLNMEPLHIELCACNECVSGDVEELEIVKESFLHHCNRLGIKD